MFFQNAIGHLHYFAGNKVEEIRGYQRVVALSLRAPEGGVAAFAVDVPGKAPLHSVALQQLQISSQR